MNSPSYTIYPEGCGNVCTKFHGSQSCNLDLDQNGGRNDQQTNQQTDTDI